MKLRIVFLIAIVLAVILIIGFFQKTNEEEIKIGFISILSGPAASYGETEKAGLDIAIEEINTAGGIKGRPVRIIYEDDEGLPEKSVNAFRKLVEIDDTKIIFGGTTSDAAFAAKPLAEENKIMFFTGGAFNSQLFKNGNYTFGFWPTSEKTGAGLANYLKDRYNKVAIISAIAGDNTEVHDYFIKEFEKYGTVIAEKFNPEENDFRTYLLKIVDKKPEALFINALFDSQAAEIAKQMFELGIELPVYGNYAFSGAAFRDILGEKAEGAIFIDASGLSTQRGKEFLKKLQAKYPGYVSDYEAAIRYDQLYLIKRAIESAGENTENMENFLHNIIEYNGVIGRFYFGPNGEILGIKNEIKEIKNGDIITLNNV